MDELYAKRYEWLNTDHFSIDAEFEPRMATLGITIGKPSFEGVKLTHLFIAIDFLLWSLEFEFKNKGKEE